MSVARLAELQMKEGVQVMLAASPGSPLSATARDKGVPVTGFSESGAYDVPGMLRLREAMSRFLPDVVHVHYSKDLHRAVPAAMLSGERPLVFTKHLGSAVRKRDPWHRFIYSKVGRATAISSFIRDNLEATTVMPGHKIDLVFPGTDTGKFRPEPKTRAEVRGELGLKEKDIVIGMMGRISPGKGFEDLIAAGETLSGDEVKFLFIGGASRNEEGYAERTRKRAQLKLGERIRFLGFKADRERYLRAMDIFAFPSHAESFGLALCEAMSTGLACAAYAKDGVLDIMEDGVNGLRVRVKDPADLGAKLGTLAGDPRLRIRLGAAARTTVERKFSEPGMLAGYAETYRKATE